MFSVGFTSVAAAILAVVEGGILPPGPEVRNGSIFSNHGREDGCHYAKRTSISLLAGNDIDNRWGFLLTTRALPLTR